MKKIILISTLLLLEPVAYSQQASPSDTFYGEKERGYFWYEPEPEPIAKKAEAPPEPPAAAVPMDQVPFSSEWLKKKLPEQMMMALNTGDPKDVAAFQ